MKHMIKLWLVQIVGIFTLTYSTFIYAGDSTQVLPANLSAMQFCCQPRALQAFTNFNYLNHGDARYNLQDCQTAQKGGEGSRHDGYPTAVMSAIFMDSGTYGMYNTGVRCTTLRPSQACSWVPSGSCPTGDGSIPSDPDPT